MATTTHHGTTVNGNLLTLHTFHWMQAPKGCRCGSPLVFTPRPGGMAEHGDALRVCLDCGRRSIRRTTVRVIHEGPTGP